MLRQSPEELSQRVLRAGRLCGVESSWFFFVFYVGAGLCCWIMPEALVRKKSEHTSVRNCAQLRSQYAAAVRLVVPPITQSYMLDPLHCWPSFEFTTSQFFYQGVYGYSWSPAILFSFAAVFDFFCSSLAPLAVQRAHFKPRAEVRCASSCAFPSIFHDVAILLLSGLEHETTDAVKASDCVLAVQALRLFASKHSDHVAAGTFSETSENFVRRRNKLVGRTYGQHVKRQL